MLTPIRNTLRRPAPQPRQADPAPPPRTATANPPGKNLWGDVKSRLPDGARFEVAYHAAETRWSGTLTIGDRVFTDTAKAVFTLLHRLDGQYRRSLAPTPKA